MEFANNFMNEEVSDTSKVFESQDSGKENLNGGDKIKGKGKTVIKEAKGSREDRSGLPDCAIALLVLFFFSLPVISFNINTCLTYVNTCLNYINTIFNKQLAGIISFFI